MFSNNVYTDFIAASKHILIPSYNIQQNQNVTKLNINCFFSAETSQDIKFVTEPLKTHFILQSLFWQEHSKLPQTNICGRNTLKPLRH